MNHQVPILGVCVGIDYGYDSSEGSFKVFLGLMEVQLNCQMNVEIIIQYQIWVGVILLRQLEHYYFQITPPPIRSIFYIPIIWHRKMIQ